MSSKPIVFSAIQPSGNLTIGNYIGTMRHWSKMQSNYECLYCVADLHALTTIQNYSFLKTRTLDALSFYLACGVDPEKSIVFIQSHVHQHSQLSWILNCFARFSELLRMTQFKVKGTQGEKYIPKTNLGLFNYPILMASDILLYQTNVVPVGYDQKQHIELTRTIADRFNSIYGDVFALPTPIINQYGSKIMALLEPKKKMSKSDINKNNVIFLLDDISSVVSKINKSVTDSDRPSAIYYDIKNKPGISNLLEIFSAISNKDVHVLSKELQGVMYTEFKKIVSDAVSKFLHKLQRRYTDYRCDETLLKKIAYEGSMKAQLKAETTLKKIYSELNFFHLFK
ncbi:tryptophan--tRNA ligase [Buchnera aphidicola]|nr:tryptophan--tRNA ligase [Buchnera aphidicola]